MFYFVYICKFFELLRRMCLLQKFCDEVKEDGVAARQFCDLGFHWQLERTLDQLRTGAVVVVLLHLLWWLELLRQRCDGVRSATKHPSMPASRPTRPPAVSRCRHWVRRRQRRAAAVGRVRRRGRRRSAVPLADGRPAVKPEAMHPRAPSCSTRISGRAVSMLMNRTSDLSHSNLSSK